ncbi:hypothetical protein CJ030_MR0G005500 [Morella rubra]|uniref:SWIM-type domain-containing protein n=1 Tax=Morella rubra TaxID=262757 RepID=A0A6A1UL08_9ROSI|nr:hypothetical protein CJ030_MR0G005500 [Morella rubra]
MKGFQRPHGTYVHAFVGSLNETRPLLHDGTTFEVDTMDEERKLVNIGKRICSYGRWQFNGIPCAHACAAIYTDQLIPEGFVDHCYRKEAYLAAYSPVIHAMPGVKDWP